MSPAQPTSTTPIKDHIPLFLDYCEVEKGLSDNTQRNYQQYLKVFTNWLKEIGQENLPPTQLDPKHIWDYRLYLARIHKGPTGAPLAKKSQNYYLIAVRALLRYFAERDIESLPSSKVTLAKQGTEENISFLDISDIERLMAVPDTNTASGLRDRALLELLFSSGMRISELVALNVDDMSVLQDKATDRTYELSIIGKGKRVRTIFISPRAAEWIRAYLAERHKSDMHTPLFINYRSKNPDTKRLTPRSIQTMIGKYARIAGLSKKVTPHTLRHTYATDLLAHGADLRSVQELLGHKNVSTTQVYTHVTNKQLRDVHERFHGGRDGDKKNT